MMTINENISYKYDSVNKVTYLINFADGYEYEIKGDLVRFLHEIEESSIEESLVKYSIDPDILDYLIEEEIIKEKDMNSFFLNNSFFGLPTSSLALALRKSGFKGILMGMMYDLNVSNRSGAKYAPNFLREHSRANLPYSIGHHQSWFQNNWSDCGNIGINSFVKQNGSQQLELEFIIKQIINFDGFPVVIGGDHSITYSILKSILKKKKIILIHIDAHWDCGTGKCVSFDNIHHGNFIDGILEEENLLQVIQIGQRQRRDSTFVKHVKTVELNVSSVDSFIQNIKMDSDAEFYISWDVDAIDPMLISSTGTPVPFGLSLNEIKCLIDIFSKLNICGIDLVEFIPDPNKVEEALLIDEIIFQIISNVDKYQYKERYS